MGGRTAGNAAEDSEKPVSPVQVLFWTGRSKGPDNQQEKSG